MTLCSNCFRDTNLHFCHFYSPQSRLKPPQGSFPWDLGYESWYQETRRPWAAQWWTPHEPTVISFDRPGQTRRPSPRTSIGECAKRKANWDCRVVSGNRRPLCNWKWKLEAWNCDTERVSMRFLTNRPYLIELNWIGYLNSSTVLLCFGLRERKLTEAIVHVCFFAFKIRMHHATQENADRGLNRLSNISKDGRVANLTSAPGGQRSRYTTVLRIRGTFCDDALYKFTFTFTLWPNITQRVTQKVRSLFWLFTSLKLVKQFGRLLWATM